MKLIFILLLIINIAYVIGIQFYANDQQAAVPQLMNAEKIILLPASENCLEWGNFHEEQMQYAETILSEMVSDKTYELEEAGNALMYWLAIPPFMNKEAANREINKLRNLGIVSFRVKDENQWKNAISLGIFHDKNEALKQLQEIENKGIENATIEERSVTLKKIVFHNPSRMLTEQMEKLVKQFEDTHLAENKCERL